MCDRRLVTTRGSFVKHRNLVPVLLLTALLTLSTATNASAQVCASLALTTQAQVDAVFSKRGNDCMQQAFLCKTKLHQNFSSNVFIFRIF